MLSRLMIRVTDEKVKSTLAARHSIEEKNEDFTVQLDEIMTLNHLPINAA